MGYIERNYPQYLSYFKPSRTFHGVLCGGDGSVAIMIRKSWYIWLYRLIRFGELSRFVHDSRGVPLSWNHVEQVVAILRRECKVYANYHGGGYTQEYEWKAKKYNHAWFVGLYSDRTTTEKALLQDPYHFWVKGYKAHFVLESATGKREHYAYYKPVKS